MKNLIFTVIALGLATVAIGQDAPEREKMSKEEKFAQIDSNGDAVISLSEFTSIERPERPQRAASQREPKDPQEVFNKIDADGNGVISQEEFMSSKGRKGKKGKKGGKDLTDEQKAERKAKKEAMKAKIVAADVDGDERLSFAEFSTIAFDEEIDYQEKFNRLDANGDGFLEKGEMKRKKKGKKKAKKNTQS